MLGVSIHLKNLPEGTIVGFLPHLDRAGVKYPASTLLPRQPLYRLEPTLSSILMNGSSGSDGGKLLLHRYRGQEVP